MAFEDGATLETLQDAAKRLVQQAKSLSARVHEETEANNFRTVSILLSDLAIAINRAEAAQIALQVFREESSSELDSLTAESIKKRLQLEVWKSANQSSAFTRVFSHYVKALDTLITK